MEKRFSGVDYATPKGVVSGYVVKWNQASFCPEIGRKEMFMKGSLKTPRTVALFSQHDPTQVLASTASKTLKLSEDEVGLKFSAQLPESAVATRESLKRGDLRGSSAGFYCDQELNETGIRKVQSARLSEISLVHDPVHSGTDLSYRSASKPKKRKWTDLL